MNNERLKLYGEFLITNDSAPYVTWQTHIQRYIFASKYCKGKTILDAACGSGYGSYFLSKNAKEVIGVDISNTALDFAMKKYKLKNLKFVKGNVSSFPFSDNSFDVIISFETIEHLFDICNYLRECKRVLKDDGVFICSTDNKKYASPYTERPLNPFHTTEFYFNDFDLLLKSYFNDVIYFGQQWHGVSIRKLRYWKNKALSKLPYGEYIQFFINRYSKIGRMMKKYGREISESHHDSKYAVDSFEGKRKSVMIAVCKNLNKSYER